MLFVGYIRHPLSGDAYVDCSSLTRSPPKPGRPIAFETFSRRVLNRGRHTSRNIYMQGEGRFVDQTVTAKRDDHADDESYSAIEDRANEAGRPLRRPSETVVPERLVDDAITRQPLYKMAQDEYLSRELVKSVQLGGVNFSKQLSRPLTDDVSARTAKLRQDGKCVRDFETAAVILISFVLYRTCGHLREGERRNSCFICISVEGGSDL